MRTRRDRLRERRVMPWLTSQVCNSYLSTLKSTTLSKPFSAFVHLVTLKAGLRMAFGAEIKVKAKPARTVVKAFPVAALKQQI